MLTIAVSKGRIYEEALPFLQQAGITPIDDPDKSRKLILQTTRDDVQLVIIRATDVRPSSNTAPPTSASPARTCCWSTVRKACTNRWIWALPAVG